MATKMPNVLFIGDLSSTFIKRDYEILSKYFEVRVIYPPKSKKEWFNYIHMTKKSVKKSDVVFGWFAGWHTAPAVYYSKRYGKRSIIVIGGYDVVSYPEIKYGAFSNIKERTASMYVLKNANLLLPVSNYLKKEILNRIGKRIIDVKVLPTGYDTNFWRPIEKKEDIVLTIASAKTVKRVKIKGLDTFVRVAKYVPEAKFILIGVDSEARDHLERMASKNVEIKGSIPNNELLPYYQKAKVYAQLSISEGLPNTLCEAMLCGCIPVGTKRGGIPEVMGDVGFYTSYGEVKETVKAIKKSLKASYELGLKARERIVSLYSIGRREQSLINLVGGSA